MVIFKKYPLVVLALQSPSVCISVGGNEWKCLCEVSVQIYQRKPSVCCSYTEEDLEQGARVNELHMFYVLHKEKTAVKCMDSKKSGAKGVLFV